jgi:hypothetical protein
MDPRRSTAKRSGACGNISRGKKREQLVSNDFHQVGLGVMIAPIVLRSRGMGQCDLVRFLPLTRCVEVLEIKGTVEKVGLRITTVRDANGTLWYLRNGEILKVGNSSQSA